MYTGTDGRTLETDVMVGNEPVPPIVNRKDRRCKEAKQRKRKKIAKSGRLGPGEYDRPHPSNRNAYCNKCGYFGKVTAYGHHLNPNVDDTICNYTALPSLPFLDSSRRVK